MSTNDIIVIGASAGGVEALKSLVRGLSPELPAAVFVVLHVGAQQSILPDLLRQAGTLPVEHGIDKAPIENGRIYVAPPDHHLMLSRGHIHITKGPKENNARPSINTLFRTAASAYGKRVSGIVLTGALNDGTVGLWEIKRHGGTTIVQDPGEALYPSMPQNALDNVQIDYNLKLAEMPPLLLELANGNIVEKGMNMQPRTASEANHFSGLTCPECRGPLWVSEHEDVKQFECRVGHRYSFDCLLEQHAITTERALWAAVLALEEEMLLGRQAAARSVNQEARQSYEENVLTKEKQAAVLREMLTRSDPAFQHESRGSSPTD